MKFLDQYTDVDAEKEVLRQTERHIDVQIKLSLASVQRGIAFASVQIVIVVLLLDNIVEQPRNGEVAACLIFTFAIVASIISCRPTRIYGSGSNGLSLENYRRNDCQGYMLATLIERNDWTIEYNQMQLKNSVFVFRISLIFAAVALLVLIFDQLELLAIPSQLVGVST